MRSTDFCLPTTCLLAPVLSVFDPLGRHPSREGVGCGAIEGRAFSRCPVPPWRVMRRRARVLAARLVRSRLHQGHPVTLVVSFDGEDRDRFQRIPVKGCALPRSEMPSFGGRWSAAPPNGGSPSRSREGRLTTDVDPMGFATLVRRDAALRADGPTVRGLATTHGRAPS